MSAPCSKIAYDSKADAFTAVARIVKSHRAKKLSVYRCERCGLWHLSHQKLKVGARSKKQMLGGKAAVERVRLT